jgi:hypothetical protein
MNPPTEQLIRDYLNRLSVASRSKLGFKDRQALLDRTRARIELDSGGVSQVSAVQVRKVLADLGDPIALIELEHARLTTGQPPSTSKEVSVREAPVPQAPVPHIPVTHIPAPGFLIHSGSGGGPNGAVRQATSAALLPPPAVRVFGDAPVPGPAASPESAEAAGAGASSPELAEAAGAAASSPESAEAAASTPAARADRQERGEDDAAGLAAGRRKAGRARFAAVVTSPKLTGLAQASLELARRNAFEVVALLVLGVGGAVYPILWVLGVGMVVSSQKWDLSDKITGIVGSTLVVIIGTVLVLVFGGQHHSLGSYGHEAWLGAGRLSRGAAVAGAGYLLWRLHRGRRQPKPPPWNSR